MDMVVPARSAPHIIDVTSGQNIILDGAWLLKADFIRQGPDLLLEGEGGQKTLLINYFNAETPPDLQTSFGAIISAELASKLAGPLAPGQFAQNATTDQLAQNTSTASIGRIETINGTAEATRTDGTKITLQQGSEIFSGDVLETGPGAAIGILLADDSTFSLAESGRMVMDEVVYDPGDQEGNATISIVQGVFSFVSGQIAKTGPDAMVLKTPVATLGIRGTKVVGSAAAEGEQNTFSLLPDDNGEVGEIAISTPFGTIILNVAGATTEMSSALQPPPPPFVLAIATINARFSQALNSLPPSPPPRDAQGNRPGEDDTPPPEGEGEGAAPPPEGEPQEGEGRPPEGDEPPLEGGPDEPPLEGEDAAEQAFQQAIEGGATEEQAFAAAANAATQEAIANGASPEEAAAAVAAAKAAYDQAILDGASPEEALQIAGNAAQELTTGFQTTETNNTGDPLSSGGLTSGGADGGTFTSDPFSGSGGTNYFDGGDSNYFDSGSDPLFGGSEGDFLYQDNPLLGSDNLLAGNDYLDGDPFFQPPLEGEDYVINLEDDHDNPTPPPEFSEVVTATTGNDTLLGSDTGNTQFVMVQGTSLGGIDTVDGGISSSDEISFRSLNNFAMVFDATNSVGNYSTVSGTVTGTVTLTDIELLFAGVDGETLSDATTGGGALNGAGTGVRLAFSPGDTGYGYIIAGTTGNNVITLADTTDLAAIYGGLDPHTVNASNILGSIIFGLDGDDTLTGSAGSDIIFGGIGADTIAGGGGSDDLLIGGAGADIFNYNAAVIGDTVVGGADADTINLVAGVHDFDAYDVETINGSTGADDVLIYNPLSNVTINLNTGADILTLSSGGTHSVNLSGVETVDGSSDNDTLQLLNAQSGTSINLLGGTSDSLILADGTNSMTATDIETITGGTGNDTITLGAVQTSGNIDLASGADSLILFNGANTLTISNTETITGGSGVDTITLSGTTATTITGGGGADVITASTNVDTFNFDQTSQLGDIITSFTSTSDKLQFSRAAFNGDGDINGTLDNFETGAGSINASGTAYFVFDSTNNDLYYDADANGAGTSLLVADLDATLAIADITFVT